MNNNYNIRNKYLTGNKYQSIDTGKSVFRIADRENGIDIDYGDNFRIPYRPVYTTGGNGAGTTGGNGAGTTGGNGAGTTGGNGAGTTGGYSAGYEDLVNGFVKGGNSLPYYGVFNPYMSAGNTNLSYYKSLASNIENNLNSLFTAKYGAGNYNMNNGWYQENALENWDKYSENQGFAQYQKLMTDLQNVNNMIAKYQSIEQDRQQQTARLGIQQDLIEKYLQEDRRIRGIENSGQAETSTNAIINAYINAGNQIRQNAENNLHEQEMAFQNAQYESMNNFNNQLQALQEREEETRTSDLKDLISYASTVDDFKLLEENFGEEISKNKTLKYLLENAKMNVEKYAKEEADAEELGKYLTNYGTSADQGISAKDLNPSMFNWNGSGTGKQQDKLINKVSEMAREGAIENGTILDLNRGGGTNLYLYYNGSFYPIDSEKNSYTKGWQGADIEDRYNEWKGE